MKICLLSSGHKPNDDRIFYKEARSLAKKYSDVWIVSPFASNIPVVKYGVKFLSIPTRTRNWVGRLVTMRELYKAALGLKADIYHCHEPESLMVAIKLKKVLKCEIIFDSHEMYSATLAQKFPKSLHKVIMSLYKLYEQAKIRQCHFVVGATWSISEYLAQTVGVEKTETILNCSLPDIFGEVRKKKWEEEIIICHDGVLTFSRGLKTMVKAIDIVRKKHRIKFRIVGDVFGTEKEWLEYYIKSRGLGDTIERTGWLDYEDVGKAISECHIGLLALENLPNHTIAAPNKIFNYMYCGLPFIAPDHCVDMKKLVEEEKCAILAQEGSAMSYANAISYLIENRDEMVKMGLNARKATDTKYSWPIMEKKLLSLYEAICAG